MLKNKPIPTNVPSQTSPVVVVEDSWMDDESVVGARVVVVVRDVDEFCLSGVILTISNRRTTCSRFWSPFNPSIIYVQIVLIGYNDGC